MSTPALTVEPLLRHQKVFLHRDDTVCQARRLFRRYPLLEHIPLVTDERRYLALLPRRSIRGAAPETNLHALPLREVNPLLPYATIYDAVQGMSQQKIYELPVVTEEGTYLGLITPSVLVEWWGQLGAVQEPGAVVILESSLRQYSLAEIASIMESDEIRILSAYLLSHSEDLQRTYIVLKVNSIYLTRVIGLLERKGYHVVAVHGDTLMERQAREQLAALLRYLEM